MSRLPVRKTYKLYVGGAFPRSESGRVVEIDGHNVPQASRKDVRDAISGGGKSLKNHKHGGVQAGGAQTGTPV